MIWVAAAMGNFKSITALVRQTAGVLSNPKFAPRVIQNQANFGFGTLAQGADYGIANDRR
jgi:hypothetical protein